MSQEETNAFPGPLKAIIAVLLLSLATVLFLAVFPYRWHEVNIDQAGIEISGFWEHYGREGYQLSFRIANRSSIPRRITLRAGMMAVSEQADPVEQTLELTLSASTSKRVKVNVWSPEGYRSPRKHLFGDPYVVLENVETVEP